MVIRGWTAGSTVKSTNCSCRGPRFVSHCSLVAHTICTTGNSSPSLASAGNSHKRSAHACVQANAHRHKIKRSFYVNKNIDGSEHICRFIVHKQLITRVRDHSVYLSFPDLGNFIVELYDKNCRLKNTLIAHWSSEETRFLFIYFCLPDCLTYDNASATPCKPPGASPQMSLPY